MLTPTNTNVIQATKFKTKEEWVAEYLRELILAGDLKRGQKLGQNEVAGWLNISITPIREAFKLLEAEGYLTSSSYRGTSVSSFDVEKAEESFELRLELEGRLTRKAMVKITQEEIEQLLSYQKQLSETVARNDHREMRRANGRFHFFLYEIAKQPQTLKFIKMLWATYPFDILNIVEQRISRVEDEHNEFLDRVISRDVDGAVEEMKKHITNGWNEFHKFYISPQEKGKDNILP